jgi:uncharacterized protein (TIGR00299 family) protein
MTLAALLDCGISLPGLKKAMLGLGISNYTLSRKKVRRHGISATRLSVKVLGVEKRRSFNDILKILEKSDLEEDIRSGSISIFRRLARAEAKVHGEKVKNVHFHEVGATDAIVDIVGVLTALKMLRVDEVYSTPIPLGTGFVDTSHGLMPLPAPATAELLKDYPVTRTDREGELTTPTGASLVSALSCGTILPSPFSVERIGYGAGHRESPTFPNLLRVIIGEVDTELEGDQVLIIETNIDDMDPQLVPHLQEEVAKAGALDVYRLPVQMKKNRPGMLLRVLVNATSFDQVTDVIFRESTTIGIRYWEVSRVKLLRRLKVIDTSLGKIRVKEVTLPSGERRTKPEHDDCLRIAREEGIPLLEVISRIEKEIGE